MSSLHNSSLAQFKPICFHFWQFLPLAETNSATYDAANVRDKHGYPPDPFGERHSVRTRAFSRSWDLGFRRRDARTGRVQALREEEEEGQKEEGVSLTTSPPIAKTTNDTYK